MTDVIKRADAVAAYMLRRMGGSEEVIAAINAIPSHAEAQAEALAVAREALEEMAREFENQNIDHMTFRVNVKLSAESALARLNELDRMPYGEAVDIALARGRTV